MHLGRARNRQFAADPKRVTKPALPVDLRVRDRDSVQLSEQEDCAREAAGTRPARAYAARRQAVRVRRAILIPIARQSVLAAVLAADGSQAAAVAAPARGRAAKRRARRDTPRPADHTPCRREARHEAVGERYEAVNGSRQSQARPRRRGRRRRGSASSGARARSRRFSAGLSSSATARGPTSTAGDTAPRRTPSSRTSSSRLSGARPTLPPVSPLFPPSLSPPLRTGYLKVHCEQVDLKDKARWLEKQAYKQSVHGTR